MSSPGTGAGLVSAIALALALTAPCVAAGGADGPLELRLAAGVFRPLDPPPSPPGWYQEAAPAESPAGWHYLVALARGPLDRRQRGELELLGAELLGYLPVHGYLVRLPAGGGIPELPFVAWLGPLPAHFKVGPGLARRAHPPASEANLRAVLHPDEPVARVVEVLAAFGPRPSASGKDAAWRVEASVPGGALAGVLSRLVALPEVEAVEEALPLRLLNQDGVWVHQSFVGPAPQETPLFDEGIFGCGQVIAIPDSGQDLDACQFADPVNGPPPISSCTAVPCPPATPDLSQRKDILYYNWSGTPTGDDDFCPGLGGGTGHGTHTSGSAAADRFPYADCAGFTGPGRDGGDGQAPGSRLVLQEMGDGLEYLTSLGGSIWNLADVAHQTGARIQSMSWGGVCHDILGQCVAGCTIPYDSLARDVDLAMWTYPDLLMVASVANARGLCPPPNAVSTPATAKNLLSVGSVGHGAAAGTASSFSSDGPVFDGRLKPTLAAQGESVVSAGADPLTTSNCDTCSLEGTSMSAPTIAGLAALVGEYYVEGFYAAGARDPGQGLVPSAALLKATLIDGAVALGSTAPAPDFLSGYGRALLGSSLAFSSSPFQLRVVDHREGVPTGGVVVRAFDVSGGTPLRATLVWTDYPAALNAATARVNELRLEVIDPGGSVWFQTLDAGSGAPAQTANPSDPHDAVNVEERLVFPSPTPGRWAFQVVGVDIPWGPQPFALVVRGALTDCPVPEAPTAPRLSTPTDQQILVEWDPVPGAAAYNVYRSFGACPGGASVPVATGILETSFLDTPVSGGVTYSYRVAATSDAAARCESTSSPCASVTAIGDCLLAPEFAGVGAATSDGLETCMATVSWEEAIPFCGSDVRYNVYRGTASGFSPDPANRIAGCVVGTSFVDSVGLVHGTDYYYVVRAEDATSGHGGPCRGGNEDGNLAEVRTTPTGPPSFGPWDDDAGDTGEAKLLPSVPWTVAPTGGNAGPAVYEAASSAGVCADLTTPVLTLAGPGQGPQLFFSTIHTLEFDGDHFGSGSVGQVEIATGPSFTSWTRVPLNPDYPLSVPFLFTNCLTTIDSRTYFCGNNLTYSTYDASLVNWAGGDVKIRFHLSGDQLLAPGGSWWVDDIQVTQALVPGFCESAPGPPPIPDGASVPGAPLQVSSGGSDLQLTWDTSQCPATNVNVYYGDLGDFSTFTGAHCDLPGTGSAVLPFPDSVWFLAVATDGVDTDGSWSRDPWGNELSYTGSSLVCPSITRHVTGRTCQ